jgi:hypothetical protein
MTYRMSPLLYDNLKTVIVESLVRSYHTAKMWPSPRMSGQAMHNTVTFPENPLCQETNRIAQINCLLLQYRRGKG